MVKKRIYITLFIVMAFMVWGCVASDQRVKSGSSDSTASTSPPPAAPETQPATAPEKSAEPAMMIDKKGFRVKPVTFEIKAGRPYMPVGAELISKEKPVPLDEVIRKLADIKGFSVSWAADVKPRQVVDVHISPEDNYWEALNNVLRQLDYFYEVEEETIVVRYKETKRYRLIMPTLKEDFKTSIGGNLIGGGAVEGKITGRTEITANIREPLDFWKLVEENLDKIIKQGEQKTTAQAGQQGSSVSTASADKGYYIADRNLGILTVTAPRKTHYEVKAYIDNLKSQLYKQVVIEAKIVEVVLNDTSEYGIDWSDILQRTFSGNISYGQDGTIYPYSGSETYDSLKFISQITLTADTTYEILMDFLKEYGQTNLLSNPKITIMNGHGASITVGTDITYIASVESTTDENGNVTFTTTEASVLSGLGLAVMANIINDDEVILYIVPVTSELQEPIEYRLFGGVDGAQVGLPRVRLRELATMAKVRSGDTLILGGQISKTKEKDTNKVPLLGDIPGLGWLFKHEEDTTNSSELVIFLKPTIVAASMGDY